MADPPIMEPTELPHPARSARWGPWKAVPRGESVPRKKLKLLLLHGFAGAPGELRPLGKALLNRGFSVVAPLLPGHGENLEAMREVLLDDWLEAVTASYESLRRDDSPVGLVGFCLGGALALHLAGRLNPRVVCCLATPAGPLPESAFPLTAGLRSNLQNANDSPSAEVRRWRSLGCHHLVPDIFLERYQELLRALPTSLPEVRCPLLVAQSRGDNITPPEDAERLVAAVRSERCKLVWSRRAGHGLPVDVGRRALFAEMVSFLEQVEQSSQLPFTNPPG
jgi:carboxylesterase